MRKHSVYKSLTSRCKNLITIKLTSSELSFFFGRLTVQIYWPKLENNSSGIGIFMSSQLNYKKRSKSNEWWVTRALALKILGFGIGFAWNHIDNPNYVEPKS